MRKVLANTTPLIALANINRLELLHNLYGTIIVPQAVMDEIIREPARQRVRASSWIHVESIHNESQKELFRARLHAGEVEVIILAREQNADLVIMDDDAAKKTAKTAVKSAAKAKVAAKAPAKSKAAAKGKKTTKKVSGKAKKS